MKKNGYRTGFVGKYGIGAKNLPKDKYDFWAGWPGWGKYEGQKDKDGNPIHLTKKLGNDSLDFLDSCDSAKPFCLSISFKAPHCQDGDPRQFIANPAYDDIYKNTVFNPPEKACNEYWDNLPDFFKKDNEARKRWKIRFSNPKLYQKMVRKYHTLVHGIDVEVGRIRKKLEQINAAENTIIIYTSDNGFYLGEHGLAGKWYPHKESIRIPLIIYDPRLKNSQKGTKRQQMALNIDLAPTMLNYAGIAAPEEMQGKSLLPAISNNKMELRRDFFYEHLLDHHSIPKNEGVIGKRYKYIRWITQEPVYETLWDLKVNPEETINFATHPEYKGVLDNMRNRFFELAQKVK
jgi:arylsulfatase A-like enzyme